MSLKQTIIDYYEYAGKGNEVESFTPLKAYLLYPITMVDDNLVNLITGIATGLSINIFTGFMSFEGRGLSDLLMWIIRMVSAITVNYCLIRIAIYCTILRIDAREEKYEKKLGSDKEIAYRLSILRNYGEYYNQIRKYTIKGVVWLVVLIICVIFIPVICLILDNRQQLCELIDCLFTILEGTMSIFAST